MIEIDIEWEGPFPVLYDRNKQTYHLSGDMPEDLRNSHGVYQIYGDHPVYGRDSLLYIGETSPSSTRRNFEIRIKEHLGERGRFWSFCGLSVRFGVIWRKKKRVNDTETIRAAESLLIAANMPALNRQHLDASSERTTDMIVRNWDFKGSIVGECSGRYWWG